MKSIEKASSTGFGSAALAGVNIPEMITLVRLGEKYTLGVLTN